MYKYIFGKIEEFLSDEDAERLKKTGLRGDFIKVKEIETPPEALEVQKAEKEPKMTKKVKI